VAAWSADELVEGVLKACGDIPLAELKTASCRQNPCITEAS